MGYNVLVTVFKFWMLVLMSSSLRLSVVRFFACLEVDMVYEVDMMKLDISHDPVLEP